MQAYISDSLSGLDFRKKYNLTEYVDSERPLIIFGMYNYEDLKIYKSHPSEVILVWQGMDARDLKWVDDIKWRKAKHYAISHWIKQSLDNYGIESELLPISATIDDLKPCPRGECIYFYSSDISEESANYYGEYMIEEIKRITALEVIRATHETYSRTELIEVYKKCFINLRLTVYDGCPNTNLEMGLMGRRSVFNGDIPHSIRWNNLHQICDDIIREYLNRDKDNRQIAADIKKFVNIPNKIFL
jgi:hypothetical protein